MAADLPTLSPEAKFQIPGADDLPRELLDRWSDTYVSLPAALAVPCTEADVVALVGYAKQHGLTIVVAVGKHLTSVPVSSKTLYVDLTHFNSISIDEGASTVRLGGGLTTGPVLEALSKAGYYTSLPNTNSVGIVGAFLGGGSSPFNSVSGLMIDNAVSVRLVTAEGKTLTLGPDSQGAEAALWNALRGAGHGLGVITELTLRIYTTTDLKLNGTSFWSRALRFPGEAVPLAAETFTKLLPVKGPISVKLILARNPPSSPAPGVPSATLVAEYYGPEPEAERVLGTHLGVQDEGMSIVGFTNMLPLGNMNDAAKMAERTGGLKRSEGTLLREPVTASTIQRSFERFVQLGSDEPDAKFGTIVYHAFDPRVLAGAASAGFFEERKTSTIVYHDIRFSKGEAAAAVDAYLVEAIAIARSGESGPFRRFANCFRHPAVLEETYSEERVAEKKRVKQVWDKDNVFWTPGL